jgi:RNA polymerase sigma-70 factor (ECF subfamily)
VSNVIRLERRVDEHDRVPSEGEASLVEIYRAHHAHVRAFAQRLLGCPAQAEDLVHDVFVALPKALVKFRGESSLRTFLIAVAVRHAQQHVRAVSRRRAAERRLALEPQPSSGTPDASFENGELGRILAMALDELPVDQRVAFVLCEVEERTSVEVAEMLGESDGNIRARVFHAKKKLRTLLERRAGRKP